MERFAKLVGAANLLPTVVHEVEKDTGAVVICENDPDRLISRLVEYYRTTHFRRPSIFFPAASTDGGQAPCPPPPSG